MGRDLGARPEAPAGCAGDALTTSQDARTRSTRLSDAYLWVGTYTLDAMCRVALDAGRREQAGPWVEELANLAALSGMRELLVRALVHCGRLGDDQGLEVAAALARQADNPLLLQWVVPPTVRQSAL